MRGPVVWVSASELPQRNGPGVTGIGSLQPDRRRLVRRKGPPLGHRAIHHAQRLIHPVGRQGRVHGRPVTGRFFRVPPVNQRLVSLPAADEPDGLVRRPRPRRGLGRGIGERGPEIAAHPFVEGSQASPVRRALRRELSRRCAGQPFAHDSAPEPLHLAEVPQQIVGVPVRARGHRLVRREPAQHLPEPGRLPGQEGEIIQVCSHARKLAPATDKLRGPRAPAHTAGFRSASNSTSTSSRSLSAPKNAEYGRIPHRDCPSDRRPSTVTSCETPTTVRFPSIRNDSSSPLTRVDANVITGFCPACRILSRRVLLISARSASVSGFPPPVPSRTSKESTSASIVTAESRGLAVSRTTSHRQRVTSMMRSWPALAPSPVRAVLISSRPESGPSV